MRSPMPKYINCDARVTDEEVASDVVATLDALIEHHANEPSHQAHLLLAADRWRALLPLIH